MRNGYHPKTNAQIIEKTNCILENILRMYVGHQHGTWKQCLYLMEFVYYGSYYSSIKTSSFHVLYGQEYLIHFSIPTPISKVEDVNEMIAIM
jgi:hypothetical protein